MPLFLMTGAKSVVSFEPHNFFTGFSHPPFCHQWHPVGVDLGRERDLEGVEAGREQGSYTEHSSILCTGTPPTAPLTVAEGGAPEATPFPLRGRLR